MIKNPTINKDDININKNNNSNNNNNNNDNSNNDTTTTNEIIIIIIIIMIIIITILATMKNAEANQRPPQQPTPSSLWHYTTVESH